MPNIVTRAALLTIAGMMPATGLAQSINPALDRAQGETQVAAAITIPLGHSADRTQTAPRVELITRSRTASDELDFTFRNDQTQWQERRLGFTLDGSDRFMINGQPLAAPDTKNNLNTGETFLVIGGVILVGAVIGAAAWYDAVNNDTGE